MAKRRKRAFPGDTPVKVSQKVAQNAARSISADEEIGGIFGFFKSVSVRETIESIVIAVALAMMFKAFEAEAFIIPTGSMAPSLQGEHKDLACSQCGYSFQVSASRDAQVAGANCPLCHFKTPLRRSKAGHKTFNGDRILVNKFVYDFKDPKRFDVIVFKNPNHAKQNYIKRLTGLPGENILIENGDIYTMTEQPDGSYEKQIQAKPPEKLIQIAERIADTKYFGGRLKQVGWPVSWKQTDGEANWQSSRSGDQLTYLASPKPAASWLRFRNNRPDEIEWTQLLEMIEDKETVEVEPVKGRLVNDYVAHNDGIVNSQDKNSVGYHWVGDIGFEAEVEIKSGSGNLYFDIVEGGAHFKCSIDVKTGQAKLSVAPPEGSTIEFVGADGDVVAEPTGSCGITSGGRYNVRFFNADDRLYFWVDGNVIDFDAVNYTRSEIPVPHYSLEDPADEQPLGIGCQNLEVQVGRIVAYRDIYYTSTSKTATIDRQLERLHRFGELAYRRKPKFEMVRVSVMEDESLADPTEVYATMRTPESWDTPAAQALFRRKKGQTEPMFSLLDSDDDDKDQFLPMGDNSAQSLDGRVWDGPRFVERDMLIGRAMFIFWPHSLQEPLPFFPNFERMGFIR